MLTHEREGRVRRAERTSVRSVRRLFAFLSSPSIVVTPRLLPLPLSLLSPTLIPTCLYTASFLLIFPCFLCFSCSSSLLLYIAQVHSPSIHPPPPPPPPNHPPPPFAPRQFLNRSSSTFRSLFSLVPPNANSYDASSPSSSP